MRIGYMRPFQNDKHCNWQKDILSQHHCDQLVIESHSSPKRRVELQKLFEQLQENDCVVVSKLSILTDSTRHLLEALDKIQKRRAFTISLQERIDTTEIKTCPFSEIVKHLVYFQSDVISEQTKQGIGKSEAKRGWRRKTKKTG